MTHLTLAARSRGGSGQLADRLFRGSSRIAALTIVVVLFAIGVLLAWNSKLTWQTFGLGFITGTDWDPVKDIYGALPFIVGTLAASAIAIVLAAPVGILTAIYLAELAPRRLAIPLTFMIELLAAIPSVVIGLWGVFILSPFLPGHGRGVDRLGLRLDPGLRRTDLRHRSLLGRGHPHDHDPADDRDDLARGDRCRSGQPA